MSHSESPQFKTHTISSIKKETLNVRNYRSLFARIEYQKNICCGSLLQVVKYYESERRKRVKVNHNQFLTITNDFNRFQTPKSQRQQIKKSRFSPVLVHTPQSSFKSQLNQQFKVKQGHRDRGNSSRKQQQKMEFDKLIDDFNTKTKEILERKKRSHLLRSSIEKNVSNEPKKDQFFQNFYQFRTIKNLKQTLSTKQESEDFQIDHGIAPW